MILDRIVAAKKKEVARLRSSTLPSSMRKRLPLSLSDKLTRPSGGDLRLIGEVKFKSPSAGELSHALDAPTRAAMYADGGVAAVSVLTDELYFDGSYHDLSRVHDALAERGDDIPLLAKEFIVDPMQLHWAAVHGADAVLLIVRITEGAQLEELLAAAHDEHLETLVEVANEEELEQALIVPGVTLVGVNARDLDTLEVDAERAARVLDLLPPYVVGVHLSGLRTADDVRRVARTNADAALVGEALMRLDDPALLLGELVGATRM